jgi:hypothetical protein
VSTVTVFRRADEVLPPKPGMFVLFGDVTVIVKLDELGDAVPVTPQSVDVLFHKSYVTRYEVTPSPAGPGCSVTLPSVKLHVAVPEDAPVAVTVY